MSKYAFFTILSSIYSLSLTAQPTLTGTTTNPVIGDGFVIHNCDTTGISPGSSGMGVTWDFSGLNSIFKSDTTAYINCDSTSLCPSFPGSSIAAHCTNFIYPLYFSTDHLYYYYEGNSDSLALRGDGAGNSGLFYKDPEIIFKYPFTYNAYFTDSFSNYDTINRYMLSGSDTTLCDAYGSLILPGTTYPNVLRIHNKQIIWDSVWGFQSGPAHIVVTDNYSWYAPGFHNFLFSIAYNTNGNNYTNIQYATGYIPSAVKTVTKNNSDLQLYPNPAKDEINISFNTEPNESISIILTDMIGREVTVIAKDTYVTGDVHILVNISKLSKGLYFVKIKTSGETFTRKLEIL